MAKSTRNPEFKFEILPGSPKKILMPKIGEFELEKLTAQQAKKLIEKGCKYLIDVTAATPAE